MRNRTRAHPAKSCDCPVANSYQTSDPRYMPPIRFVNESLFGPLQIEENKKIRNSELLHRLPINALAIFVLPSDDQVLDKGEFLEIDQVTTSVSTPLLCVKPCLVVQLNKGDVWCPLYK